MEASTRKVDAAIAANDIGSLTVVFSPSGMSDLGQGEQRALCGYLVKKAVTTPNFLPAAFATPLMAVLSTCLSNLPTVVEHAADSTLRQMLFDYLVNKDGDYSGAARILGGMRMESEAGSPYYKSPADTCDVYVNIAECFLEEDETVEADSAVTKAGMVVENITEPDQHMGLILRYKSTYARVLDANRKFLQASSRYHDLSQSATDLIDADDLLQLLGRAATCAILAPSGAQKHRVLGLVYQDDRLHQLDAMASLETHAMLVTKMYCSQVIRPAEVVQFEASLSDHQKALRGDGYTIVQQSVMEHNMISVSRLYKSIYLTELSKILGNNVAAEKMAATMIMEGSLHGEIDQVDGILHFRKDEEDAWNRGIMSFCTELNNVTDSIKEVTAA